MNNKAGMSFRMCMIQFRGDTSPDLAWSWPFLAGGDTRATFVTRTEGMLGQDAHATGAFTNEAGMSRIFCEMHAAGPLPSPDLGGHFETYEKRGAKPVLNGEG